MPWIFIRLLIINVKNVHNAARPKHYRNTDISTSTAQPNLLTQEDYIGRFKDYNLQIDFIFAACKITLGIKYLRAITDILQLYSVKCF